MEESTTNIDQVNTAKSVPGCDSGNLTVVSQPLAETTETTSDLTQGENVPEATHSDIRLSSKSNKNIFETMSSYHYDSVVSMGQSGETPARNSPVLKTKYEQFIGDNSSVLSKKESEGSSTVPVSIIVNRADLVTQATGDQFASVTTPTVITEYILRDEPKSTSIPATLQALNVLRTSPIFCPPKTVAAVQTVSTVKSSMMSEMMKPVVKPQGPVMIPSFVQTETLSSTPQISYQQHKHKDHRSGVQIQPDIQRSRTISPEQKLQKSQVSSPLLNVASKSFQPVMSNAVPGSGLQEGSAGHRTRPAGHLMTSASSASAHAPVLPITHPLLTSSSTMAHLTPLLLSTASSMPLSTLGSLMTSAGQFQRFAIPVVSSSAAAGALYTRSGLPQSRPLIPCTVLEHSSDSDEAMEGVKEAEAAGTVVTENLISTIETAQATSRITEKEFTAASLQFESLPKVVQVDVSQKHGDESDMDYTSDSESRLVVDSDSRTDDALPEVGESEDDQDDDVTQARFRLLPAMTQPQPQPQPLSVVPTVVEQTNNNSNGRMHQVQDSQIKREPSPFGKHLDTSSIGYPFTYFPQKSMAVSHDNSSRTSPVCVIPSVVSDMGQANTLIEALRKPNTATKAELKSLPADFYKSVKPEPMQALNDDSSLLKMNRPLIQTPPIVTIPAQVQKHIYVEPKTEVHPLQKLHEQGQRKVVQPLNVLSRPNSLPMTASQPEDLHKAKVKIKTKGPAEVKGIFDPEMKKSVNKLQGQLSLPLDVAKHEPIDMKDNKYGIYGGGSMDSEGRIKKEKMSALPDTDDMLKDTQTCEEQVMAIIKKYNLLDTPERREVSVKDMRRVIPQLIMCLFSKEDHHARKVKGLWEKRPENWPTDIPYCDPNNSNRGSDGTGKPKKETLHKMFNFLLERYVQKSNGKVEALFTMPPPTPETPQPMPQYKIKPKPKDKPQQSMSMIMPPIYQQSQSVPAMTDQFPGINLPVSAKNCTFVATTNLQDMMKRAIGMDLKKSSPNHEINRGGLAPTMMDSIPEEGPPAPRFKSLPVGAFSESMQSMPEDLPIKRQKMQPSLVEVLKQKRLPQMQAGDRGTLPTVVGMHSPVQVSSEYEQQKQFQEYMKKQAMEKLQEPQTVSSPLLSPQHPAGSGNMPGQMLGLPPGFPPAQLRAKILEDYKLLMEMRGGSPQRERFVSLPNIAMMTRFHPPQPGVSMSAPLASPTMSNVSTCVAGTRAPAPQPISSSAPMSLPISSAYPFIQSLPSPQGAQPFLTTQALSGVPILKPEMMAKLAQEGTIIHGVMPTGIPHSEPQMNSPQNMPQSQRTDQNVPLSYVKTSESKMTQPHKNGFSEAPSFHSMPNIQVARTSPSSVPINSQPIRKRHRTIADLEPDSKIVHNQSDDLQAANAILMLSNAPVVSPSDKTSEKIQPEPQTEISTDQKPEYHSIDSAYQSLQNPSMTDSLKTEHHQKSMLPFPQQQMHVLPMNQQIGQPPVLPFYMLQPFLQQQAASEMASKANMMPMSLPMSLSMSSPSTNASNVSFASMPQPINLETTLLSQTAQNIPKHTVESQVPQIKAVAVQRSPSPGSDTSSAEVSSTRQSPIESANQSDHPLSLVLRHQHSTTGQESVAMEVSKEESWNPIQETMGRIQEKMSKVEALHEARRFHEKDLSLLMLVLDLLKQKQSNLRQKDLVDFMLNCHKLEATFDVALVEKHVPDVLREDWRDYIEKNYFEVVARARPRHIPNTEAPVFQLIYKPCSHRARCFFHGNIYFQSRNVFQQPQMLTESLVPPIGKKINNPVELQLTTPESTKNEFSNSSQQEAEYRGSIIVDDFDDIPPQQIGGMENASRLDAVDYSRRPGTVVQAADVEQHVKDLMEALNDPDEGFTTMKPLMEKLSIRVEEIPENVRPKHTSDGCHTYAKKEDSKTKRIHEDISNRIYKDTGSKETVIRISKGQKCVSLDEQRTFSKEVKLNLRYAICTEDLIDEFGALKLHDEDLENCALICFHEAAKVKEDYCGTNENDKRIIQIIDEMMEDSKTGDCFDVVGTVEKPKQSCEIPVSDGDGFDVVGKPKQSRQFPVSSMKAAKVYGNESDDNCEARYVSPPDNFTSEFFPWSSQNSEDQANDVGFSLDDVDIEIVDKDEEEEYSVDIIGGIPNKQVISPIQNTEDYDIVSACATTLLPSLDDMRLLYDGIDEAYDNLSREEMDSHHEKIDKDCAKLLSWHQRQETVPLDNKQLQNSDSLAINQQ